ncbi:Uncharacterised protein [Shigella sonnei]|nr:Uncharacterised protein [Shigella sonnei]CSF89749.1 Uncharacterised protein [Shigella sonnei]CSG21746.1 Uncharacterised protein [Shigella sonnei]CSG26921.1 Uncharacterised protein [Shigella sonnei]CSG49297.1 Uncharacterised protein [Shigella sonnei]
MPLIKATLLTLPASSRTYSVRMGAIEPVATWMINVVTNRLSTSFGFLSDVTTSRMCSISFLLIGWNFSLMQNRVTKKQSMSTLAVIKNTGRKP